MFYDEFVRQFQGIARPAKRKLEAVNVAGRLAAMQANGIQRIYTFNAADFAVFKELSIVIP